MDQIFNCKLVREARHWNKRNRLQTYTESEVTVKSLGRQTSESPNRGSSADSTSLRPARDTCSQVLVENISYKHVFKPRM